jgi:hypothetical protein
MSKFALVGLMGVVLCAGCVDEEVKTLVHRNADMQAHFVGEMQAGRATDAEIRENVQVNAAAWQELDDLLQGTPVATDASAGLSVVSLSKEEGAK